MNKKTIIISVSTVLLVVAGLIWYQFGTKPSGTIYNQMTRASLLEVNGDVLKVKGVIKTADGKSALDKTLDIKVDSKTVYKKQTITLDLSKQAPDQFSRVDGPGSKSDLVKDTIILNILTASDLATNNLVKAKEIYYVKDVFPTELPKTK